MKYAYGWVFDQWRNTCAWVNYAMDRIGERFDRATDIWGDDRDD